VPPCIVVGIWNNGALRHAEYFPQAPHALMTPATRADLEARKFKHAPLADKCLQFLVTELKPYIDAHYATAKAREHTFLMGSSMGGLISLYGLCEYPQVFGGAACLSMHSPMTSPALINNQTDRDVASKFRDYLTAHLHPANPRTIYIDYGSLTLDAVYAPYQQKTDAVLQAKGYTAAHWQTRSFPGESHSETSWAKRLAIPFTFLLTTPPGAAARGR
jgi:enterochelin esterase-like enzyme